MNPRLTCAHIRCGKPSSITDVLYRKKVPLCASCYLKWNELKRGSKEEQVFLACCDDPTPEAIDKTACALQSVL